MAMPTTVPAFNQTTMIQQVITVWSREQYPWYNCNMVIPAGQWWSDNRGQVNLGLGIWCIIFGVVAETLYLPCMIAMYHQLSHSCYKIMFFLGFTDMAALALNSLATGAFFITGDVYCTQPILNFYLGAIALALWCCACFTCLVLVTNRLLDIIQIGRKYGRVFDGGRTWYILVMPFCYGICFGLFTPPLLFNSRHMAWFFNPYLQDDNTTSEQVYVNYFHTTNNLFVVVATCVLYGVLCYYLMSRKTDGSSFQGKPIFIQSSLICMVNLIAALIYVYMQFFPIPGYFVVIGHISWQLGHGCPAFIYLILNKTIQRHVLRMFRLGAQGKNIMTFNSSNTPNEFVF